MRSTETRIRDLRTYFERHPVMTARLTESEVLHVAHLARLAVTPNEVQDYIQKLSRILEYMDQLNEVDTKDVPPTAHPLPVSNVYRDDVPHECWSPQQALANAPQSQDGYFQVPKVLSQESA